MSATAQRAYVDTLTETLVGTGKAQNPMRVDDVVRKNEVMYILNCHWCVIYNFLNNFRLYWLKILI